MTVTIFLEEYRTVTRSGKTYMLLHLSTSYGVLFRSRKTTDETTTETDAG